MSQTTNAETTGLLEEHHVDPIPAEERFGKARDTFFVWFAANLNIAAAITGALPALFGLNLFWSITSIIVGNLAGAAITALHAPQGPKLGVPQLIQSRGQFGFHGALLPVALSLVLYVGFFAVGTIPASQSLNALAPGIGTDVGILLVAIPSLIVAIVGFRWISAIQKISVYAFTLGFLIVSVAVIGQGGLDFAPGPLDIGPFLAAVSVMAVFQLSYSPYVSDYTRYLPAKAGFSGPFRWTLAGLAPSAIWTMIVVAIITVQFPEIGTVEAIDQVIGGFGGDLVLLTIALGVIGVNAMNLYGGMLSLITAASSLTRLRPGAGLRIVGIGVIFAAALLLSVAASSNFLANYQNFLLLLLYFFIPWTAINLTDFYLVKRGRYDVDALFDPHGVYAHDAAAWTFGGVAYKAMIAYVVGMLVQLPFANSTWWKGWAVDSLGGADIAWIVGLLVPAGVYYLLARPRHAPPITSSVGEPVAEDERVMTGSIA